MSPGGISQRMAEMWRIRHFRETRRSAPPEMSDGCGLAGSRADHRGAAAPRLLVTAMRLPVRMSSRVLVPLTWRGGHGSARVPRHGELRLGWAAKPIARR